MGKQAPQDQGYPRSLQKKDWAYYRYCGGAGGGDCVQVQNNTHVSFAIDVNPYLVRNRDLLLRNPEFFGIVLYQDGGPAGFCDHSATGGPQDWYLGFDADNTLTDAEVIAENLLQDNLTPPFDIFVPGSKLPQPTDPNWDDKIWVHIVWTDPLFVSDQIYIDNVQYLRVVQHNFDVRQ
jgi:hypothetical protein